MRCLTVLCLLVVCYVCLSVAQVPYEDCCLKYVKRLGKGIQRHAVSYRRQVADGGCNLSAVIFTMRKGRVYCTNPKDKWVTDLINAIEKRQRFRGPKKGGKPYKG